jgi:RNA polymerase sigma-70 factor (ECF subfamily)
VGHRAAGRHARGRRARRRVAASLDEPERFAVLFDRHAPTIHQYVARRLGRDAADDVTAETYLTAFRIRARYDSGRAGVRPWLHGIAAKLISRHRREEVRALKLPARTGHDPVAETWTDSADDRVTAQAASRPPAKALAALAMITVRDAWGVVDKPGERP